MKVPPRQTPPRDDYYMGRAFWAAKKSKDPRTQVGAYIVSSTNEPISSGYNGPPSLIPDDEVNWDRPHKYPFIHHAEDNAIWYGRHKCMHGATIYVTAPPCKSCMLDIVRSGITRVVFFKPKVEEGSMLSADWDITQEIASLGRVWVSEFCGNLNWMREEVMLMEKLGIFDSIIKE